MENGSLAESEFDNDLSKLFLLSICFFGGVLLTFIALGLVTRDAPINSLGRQAGPVEQLERAVGEPVGEVEVEVAGAVCDASLQTTVTNESTSLDVVELWNQTVVSPGDSCMPAFDEALGSDWSLTNASLGVWNEIGSFYEVVSIDETVTGMSIYLAVEDVDRSEGLQSLITTMWGEENLDWNGTCLETDRGWSGSMSDDGLYLEVSICDAL